MPGFVRSPLVSNANASHCPILLGSKRRPSLDATTSKLVLFAQLGQDALRQTQLVTLARDDGMLETGALGKEQDFLGLPFLLGKRSAEHPEEEAGALVASSSSRRVRDIDADFPGELQLARRIGREWINGAVSRLAADKTIGGAEAKSQSMLALIDKGEPEEAHPAFWERAIRDGGGFGSIIGRNSFQHKKDGALKFLSTVMGIYEGSIK